MKTRVTKCYLIEVVDSEGYAVTDDFWFGTRKEAEEKANALKNDWLSLHEAQTECKNCREGQEHDCYGCPFVKQAKPQTDCAWE